MSEIRKRIEQGLKSCHADDDASRAFLYAWHFKAGNLVPADQVDARIAEAARAEREKCAQEAEAWASGSGSNVAESLYRFAAAIREQNANSEGGEDE